MRIVLQRQGLPIVIFEPPFLRALRERRLELVLGVPWSVVALRRVPVTEARRTAELVLHIEIKVTGFALATLFPFHVFFASTSTCVGVAIRLIFERSGDGTSAGFTPVRAKIVKVDVAAVAFFSSDTLLALALALCVTLEASGAYGVAVTCFTVLVFELVEVFTATFTVRAISVVRAVQAMSSVASAFVEFLVEEATVGKVITIAS